MRKITKDLHLLVHAKGKSCTPVALVDLRIKLAVPTVNVDNPSLHFNAQEVRTNPYVANKILNGANLFAGGMYPHSVAEEGAVVEVTCQGSRVATGVFDGRDVVVWSCWQDRVMKEYGVGDTWSSTGAEGSESGGSGGCGGGEVVTPYGAGFEVRKEEAGDELGALTVVDLGFGLLHARSPPLPLPPPLTREGAELLLRRALAKAAKDRKEVLPILASTLYSEALKGAGEGVNAKAAGYASALELIKDLKWATVEEKEGVASVVGVDWKDRDFSGVKKVRKEEAKSLRMVRLLTPSRQLKEATGLDPWEITKGATTEERRGTDFLTEKEVKVFLKRWVEPWTDRGRVSQDPLVGFEGKINDFLDAAIKPNFQKGYALVLDGGIVRMVGNEKFTPLNVKCSKRGGNKHVTQVTQVREGARGRSAATRGGSIK